MEYIKFHIDEMEQEFVFCEYREITEDKKGPLKSRAFPFAKIIEKEPKIQELVDGPITGIYYEQRGNNTTSERQWIDRIEPLEQETIDWIITLVKKICIEEVYDELLKPPTIDEQVEDFIKEFFEENKVNILAIVLLNLGMLVFGYLGEVNILAKDISFRQST